MSSHLKPPEPLDLNQSTTSNNDDELTGESLRYFSRSPHPYHRTKGGDLPPPLEDSWSLSLGASGANTPTSLRAAAIGNSIAQKANQSRKDGRDSPSESGSEADDEGYSGVKALPPPPLKPRKGLRDSRGTAINGSYSPLLTPTQVDEDGARLRRDYFKREKSGSRAPSPTDEEAVAARRKYAMRRRAELLRRTTETALLGIIALAVLRKSFIWDNAIYWHRAELFSFVSVLPGLAALYIPRILAFGTNKRIQKRIHVPAAFDPAPLLYPVFLPVLIVLALSSSMEKALLPNMILGLSTLPPRLLPYGGHLNGYSMVHWLLAAVPLIASENTEWPSKLFAPKPYKLKLPSADGLNPEMLVALFALHQALLPPLQYLTTTSLLPAELHLLSIGLINILLFSDSPQTNILAILLWLGGLALFVFCGHVLYWGVILARVPKWRFRRVGRIIKARQTFLGALSNSLGGAEEKAGIQNESSDDEQIQKAKARRLRRQSLKLDDLGLTRTLSAREPSVANAVNGVHADGDADTKNPPELTLSPRQRSSTLPAGTLPTLSLNRAPSTSPTRTKRNRKTIAQYYMSLSSAQANLRKWLYAVYVYGAILTIIIGPIRLLISHQALNNTEPFGWAISYLFGEITLIQDVAKELQLDSWWIPLPALPPFDTFPLKSILTTPIPILRLTVGTANTRLLLILWCILIISVGLLSVLTLTIVEVDTRRKVFHGMMVAMFLPTIFIDPCFISLALGLVLNGFLLLDLIRASQLPPLSKPIARFLTPYVDGRDLRGPVVVSHIFLLIGCAIPLWLSLAGIERVTMKEPWIHWDAEFREVAMVSGVICVGMGDAAASLIGRRYGRRKWPWAGGKSLEGSVAFAMAVTGGLVLAKVWLRVGGWDVGVDVKGGDGGSNMRGPLGLVTEWGGIIIKASIAASMASLMEAVLTGCNDNVVVPVVLWLCVKGLDV